MTKEIAKMPTVTQDDLLFNLENMDIDKDELQQFQKDFDLKKHRKVAKQRAFLNYYMEEVGDVAEAARRAKVDKSLHYWWLKTDEAYAGAFDTAKMQTMDTIDSEIVRRGVKGYEEDIVYKGEVTGKVKRFSDNLLMFRAKRLDPAYKDSYDAGKFNIGNIEIKIVPPKKLGPVIEAEATEVETEG